LSSISKEQFIEKTVKKNYIKVADIKSLCKPAGFTSPALTELNFAIDRFRLDIDAEINSFPYILMSFRF
jgi:hypothetical protein